jgi:uncharacterized repeat protein (TIGR01451 family)
MKKALVVILIFSFIAALGWAAIYFFKPAASHVTLDFDVPGEVRAGKPFDLSVSYSNFSDRQIEDAKLSLIVQQDVSFVGLSRDQRVKDVSIGTIGPGSLGKEQFQLLVLGSSETVKHVTARLRYRISGSSSEFEREETADLTVEQSAVLLNIKAPEKIQSGETFEMAVEYTNTSAESLKDLRLRVTYPPSFQFQKASEDPSRSNNEWALKALAPGQSGHLTLTGSVIAPENAFTNFVTAVLGGAGREEYEIASQSTNVTIAVSPLSVSILPNEDPNYIARTGDLITYRLRYRNSSEVAMENVSLRATLSGEMFEMSTLTSEGFLNSLTNTVAWTPATSPQLRRLESGTEGQVDLTVKLKEAFPIRRVSDKNYSVKVQAQVESPTSLSGGGKTISLAVKEVKIMGAVDLDKKILFRDAASGILNSGPYPPRVNRTTQYTVHWIIRNSATDLTGVRVTATLLSGAKFTGKIKSNIDPKPVYNSATGQVTWDVGGVMATRGVVGEPIEAIFQIEHTPAVNQVGGEVPLLSESRLVAKDSFTGTSLADTEEGSGTALPDDVSLGSDRQIAP